MLRREQLQLLSKDELIEIILTLESRIAALEKNSSNSSKPPSSDFHMPKRNQSLRTSSGRKSGGQHGHAGITREQTVSPDEVITCRPEVCHSCKRSLHGITGLVWEKRQVADIPPMQMFVKEYRSESISCPDCKARSIGIFPDQVSSTFQLGTHFQSLVVYLSVVHHLPFERLARLVNDLWHCPVSQGTIDTILSKAADSGKPLHESIRSLVKRESWVGGDETGVGVEKKTWWQWVWQNTRGSFYAVDESRGYAVVERYFGEDYTGTLVHDCWSAQNNTVANFHQLCHAHLLRDLNFCLEADKSQWAYTVKTLLQSSERAQTHIWQDTFDPVLRVRVIARYNEALLALINEPVAGRETKRLQKRFRKHREKIFHFLTSPNIPFHNNGSEQAIRNAKVKQKISGSFRSAQGARRHAILLSIIETCKKQGMDVFLSLQLLCEGKLSLQGG